MAPTKIEAAEISQAFNRSSKSMIYQQQGKIKIWEMELNIFMILLLVSKNMVIANKDAWDKLDKSTQDLIRKEAALAERKGSSCQKWVTKMTKKP